MRNLPPSTDPRLIVGTEGFSDAGVFQVSDNLLMVQSLDFFAPLVDDPYVFGQIAAANSLSDIFAMGATPVTALNIVCFPDDQLGLDVLSEILRGGTDKVHQAGASIVGGHSIRDNEIKYGLSVTGIATPAELMTNRNAQPGDVLILTKRLGTGFVTTAMKKNKCTQETVTAALDGMATLNQSASQAAQQAGAHAVTDITGFGLAVHACELADSSDVTLEIELAKLPLLPGAHDLVKKGFATRANQTNQEFCQSNLKIDPTAGQELLLEMIFDPQTSGGLLISVPQENAQAMVDRIRENNDVGAVIIGSTHSRRQHALEIKP